MNKSRGRRSSQGKSRPSSVSRKTSGPLSLDSLTAISPIDGRYRSQAGPLAMYFSEYALMRARLVAETEYLIALSKTRGIGLRRLTDAEMKQLRALPNLSAEDARIIKAIEREGYEGIPATNHDVKAIEYFIKKKLDASSLKNVLEWVHFALTSEDINSVAYALMIRDAFETVILSDLETLENALQSLAKKHAKVAMLARTHGQSASPTTFGKEMNVFLARLRRQIDALKVTEILVKWGGATGNYNAHTVAAPEVDWVSFSRKYVEGLNIDGNGKKHFVRLSLNEVTTQIEPHDTLAEFFDTMRRTNTILIDLSQDMWRYISDGWITQKPKEGEVGSSAMPHKVNPIDFENAEGNLGVANALFEFFSRKLPVSRLQRDLSDSTVERAIGTAFAHSLVAYKSIAKGFGKIAVNTTAMQAALSEHPEVVAEAIQTVLRKEGVAVPYEKLRDLTRGKKVTLKDFASFIDSLDIDTKVKTRLKKITPQTYTGIAEKLAKL